jgi:hypothetical protein
MIEPFVRKPDGSRTYEYRLPETGAVTVPCQRCRAPITFVQTGCHPDGRAKLAPVHVDSLERRPDGRVYGVSHFRFCPFAREFSRNRHRRAA